MNIKQRKIQIEPKTKVNYNIYIVYGSPHFILISRIVTEKPHQGSVNKVLYCIVL